MIKKLNASDLTASFDPLSVLLKGCVEAGANVNFILPFSNEEALGYWKENAYPAVLSDIRLFWIAKIDGEIAGTVQLIKTLSPNQEHRCEVTKLLVKPKFRRRGIADQLMATLIEEARQLGKTLITLDTVTDSPAQRLYERHGFKLAGVIPNFAKKPDTDELVPTSYMYLEM